MKTVYDPKPIPIRSYDWEAIDEDRELTGYGQTEQEAIEDLQEQLNDAD